MAEEGKVTVRGTDLYFGPCKNSNREGLFYVSFDKKMTYIVRPENATEKKVREIGPDHEKWQALSVQLPHNDLWNV